jgi:hypothetical protein
METIAQRKTVSGRRQNQHVRHVRYPEQLAAQNNLMLA